MCNGDDITDLLTSATPQGNAVLQEVQAPACAGLHIYHFSAVDRD